MKTGICDHCGKDFELRHPNKKYCSRNCQHYAYMYRRVHGFGARKVDEIRKEMKD